MLIGVKEILNLWKVANSSQEHLSLQGYVSWCSGSNFDKNDLE